MESDNIKEHVYIFGEEVGAPPADKGAEGGKEHRAGGHHGAAGRKRMQECHDGGGAIFGSLLLLAGVVLLLNNFGVISWVFWHAIAPLWPLLLVLMGLRIIFGRSRMARVLTALLAIAFGLLVIAYGLIRINSPLSERVPTELRNSIETIRIIQIQQ